MVGHSLANYRKRHGKKASDSKGDKADDNNQNPKPTKNSFQETKGRRRFCTWLTRMMVRKYQTRKYMVDGVETIKLESKHPQVYQSSTNLEEADTSTS